MWTIVLYVNKTLSRVLAKNKKTSKNKIKNEQ